MKKILIAVAALVLTASLSYAAQDGTLKATEPVGAIVEAGGIIVGNVTSVVEKSLGGGKTEGSLVLSDENGKTRIIPLDDTVTIIDNTFNAITLNQLKGKKVSVEVSEESGKAKKVQEIK